MMEKRYLIRIAKICPLIAALFVAYNAYFSFQDIDNPLKTIFYIMALVFILLTSIASYMSRRMEAIENKDQTA